MATYSDPYRLYYVTEAESKKQRQFLDEGKARAYAEELQGRALKVSKFYYSTLYLSQRHVRRVSTKATTRPLADAWVRERRVAQATGRSVDPVRPAEKLFGEAIDLWLTHRELSKMRPKTLRD